MCRRMARLSQTANSSLKQGFVAGFDDATCCTHDSSGLCLGWLGAWLDRSCPNKATQDVSPAKLISTGCHAHFPRQLRPRLPGGEGGYEEIPVLVRPAGQVTNCQIQTAARRGLGVGSRGSWHAEKGNRRHEYTLIIRFCEYNSYISNLDDPL